MPLLAYYNVSQVFEVSVCNTGFCIMTIIFIRQNIIDSKSEYKHLEELRSIQQTLGDKISQDQLFEFNCNSYGLSSREIGVAKLVVEGFSNKTISDKLFIAERTVSTHISNIFLKVKVSSRMQLLKKLYQ